MSKKLLMPPFPELSWDGYSWRGLLSIGDASGSFNGWTAEKDGGKSILKTSKKPEHP
jgi:hypothetical protein